MYFQRVRCIELYVYCGSVSIKGAFIYDVLDALTRIASVMLLFKSLTRTVSVMLLFNSKCGMCEFGPKVLGIESLLIRFIYRSIASRLHVKLAPVKSAPPEILALSLTLLELERKGGKENKLKTRKKSRFVTPDSTDRKSVV